MKKFVAASLLFVLAPLTFAAPPSSQELVSTYKAQLKAVASHDRAGLAATLDEETCRDVREVFSIYQSKPAEARVLHALTGMEQSAMEQLTPCEQTAQVTLGLSQLSKYSSSESVPNKVTLLGVVEDGPSRVFGVFRSTITIRDVEVTSEELVSFAKNGQQWKIAGNTGLKSLLAGIKAMNR